MASAKTTEREALRRLHDWAQIMMGDTHYTGDHPIAVARNVLQKNVCGVCFHPVKDGKNCTTCFPPGWDFW